MYIMALQCIVCRMADEKSSKPPIEEIIFEAALVGYKIVYNTVFREILVPVLFSPLSPSLSGSNLRLDEFRWLKLSLFKLNCVWPNSRRGETVYKCRKGRNKLGENNPIYNIKKIWVSVKYIFSESSYI